MYADADCRQRDRLLRSRRCSISLIHARKTASVAIMANPLSARVPTLRSVLAATLVLDFARVNKARVLRNQQHYCTKTLSVVKANPPSSKRPLPSGRGLSRGIREPRELP